ncbi:MAG: AraC family transcriptional regulator [Xanthomonadaceae bacterium]|nr:AraC family transcriptional regulator [Xanthomonadaceae bacterium]
MAPRSTLTIGFFVTPDFVVLDLSGALEPFFLANADGQERYRLRFLSHNGGPVRSCEGLVISTEPASIEGLDTLFVIAGERSTQVAVPSDQIALVQSAIRRRVRRVASVCVGAFVLAAAGALNGRRATTHWFYASALQAAYPRIRVDGDRIFTRDGRLWTSAGITAGIDLALAMIEDDYGRELTRTIARQLVIAQRRTGGQLQFSTLLRVDPDTDRMRRVLSHVREHLGDSLTVERLAEIANLSVRQFGRAFMHATGTTPAKLVERLRVEAAKPRAEEGRETLEVIAAAVGFTSADHMRLAFLRVLGQSPRVIRRNATDVEAAPDSNSSVTAAQTTRAKQHVMTPANGTRKDSVRRAAKRVRSMRTESKTGPLQRD